LCQQTNKTNVMNQTNTTPMKQSQVCTFSSAGAYSYETIVGDIKLTSQALQIYGRWYYTIWNQEGEVVSQGKCNTKSQAKFAPLRRACQMNGIEA
jgi:hypothetical protein